jgi:hypothetical protein
MPNLMNKLKKNKNNFVKKTIPYIFTAAGLLGSNAVHSQWTIPLNEQPLGYQRTLNVSDRDYIHALNGKDSLDFYGSGDVDKNGVINYLDSDSIYAGADNVRCDVNGDGVCNMDDGLTLDSLISGQITHLPSDWDKLSTNEKIHWIERFKEIDKGDTVTYNRDTYNCAGFSQTAEFTGKGIENLDKYPDYSSYFDYSQNGLWNIPIYFATTKIQGGGPHAINAVFVGPSDSTQNKDPLNFEQWYFFEPQNDEHVLPGDISMNKDEYAHIHSLVEMKRWDGVYLLHSKRIVGWDLNNGVAALKEDYVHANLVTEFDTPNSIHNPKVEKHNLKVYTNGNSINVDYFADENEKVKTKIIDMGGRCVKTIEDFVLLGSNTLNIPKSNLKKGIYIISVEDENQSNVQNVKYLNIKE